MRVVVGTGREGGEIERFFRGGVLESCAQGLVTIGHAPVVWLQTTRWSFGSSLKVNSAI
jgi:hypothetical protein